MKELSELKLETTRLSRQIGIIKKWFAGHVILIDSANQTIA